MMGASIIYVGGTSCCCKSTLLEQKDTDWQRWKNSQCMGALKAVKNVSPLAAHTWAVTNLLATTRGNKVLVDRTPLDNECYRMVYYLMVHPDRHTNPYGILDEYIAANNTAAFFEYMTSRTVCVFIVDTNLDQVATRMRKRNQGSDSIRWSDTEYHHCQNVVFTYIHQRYPSVMLFNLANGTDFQQTLRYVKGCLQSLMQQHDTHGPCVLPEFFGSSNAPVAVTLMPNWQRLDAITRR